MVCVLGRLVPHKQVEHAVDAVAHLPPEHPDLRLVVVGSGWWQDRLRAYVARARARRRRVVRGHVSEERKHQLLAAAWVLALPSLKEGWGLVVGEAAQHATPALAYRAAGGTTESVVDGVTGLLADDAADYAAKLSRLIEDGGYREKLGEAAQRQARSYTWDHATESFGRIIDAAIRGERHLDGVDPEER